MGQVGLECLNHTFRAAFTVLKSCPRESSQAVQAAVTHLTQALCQGKDDSTKCSGQETSSTPENVPVIKKKKTNLGSISVRFTFKILIDVVLYTLE